MIVPSGWNKLFECESVRSCVLFEATNHALTTRLQPAFGPRYWCCFVVSVVGIADFLGLGSPGGPKHHSIAHYWHGKTVQRVQSTYWISGPALDRQHNGRKLQIYSNTQRDPLVVLWPSGFLKALGTKAKKPYLFRKVLIGLSTPRYKKTQGNTTTTRSH